MRQTHNIRRAISESGWTRWVQVLGWTLFGSYALLFELGYHLSWPADVRSWNSSQEFLHHVVTVSVMWCLVWWSHSSVLEHGKFSDRLMQYVWLACAVVGSVAVVREWAHCGTCSIAALWP